MDPNTRQVPQVTPQPVQPPVETPTPDSGLRFTKYLWIFLAIFVAITAIGSTAYFLNKNQTKQIVAQPSPTPNGFCTNDSQCSKGYKCQVIEGQRTNCITDNETGPKATCQPTTKIIKGRCKLTENGKCQTDGDCNTGLICHRNICTQPTNGQNCLGQNDTSCPDGYKCIQKCGPPVARPGDQPPGYFCEVEELANKPRNCPI